MSKLKIFILLIVVSFAISSCTTKSPTQTAAATENSTPEATATTAPVVVNECLSCHTEKQRLIDTAKPVVVAEAESKGVG